MNGPSGIAYFIFRSIHLCNFFLCPQNPPPAAVDFLTKIREVMSIAKEKMTSKRFIPILTDIPEEELYHTIDLGWDIPCAHKGRRFSVISLKRENSRRAGHCGGCPGCDNSTAREIKVPLIRSNSCKTCVSDDYKQKIVRKWLDEVPSPPPLGRPVKSVAKVSGTPRIVEPKKKEEPPVVAPVQPMKTLDIKLTKAESPKLKVAELSKAKVLEPVRNKLPELMKLRTLDAVSDLNEPLKNKSSEIFKTKTTETVMKKASVPNKLTEFTKELPRWQLEEKRKFDIKVIRSEIKELPLEKPKIVHLSLMNNKPENKIVPKNINHATRRIRKRLPPPPPPPESPPEPPKPEDGEPIPVEFKMKMEAVIKELNKCRRTEPIQLEEVKMETVTPITSLVPKIVIPVLAADSQYYSDDNMLSESRKNNILCVQKQHYSDVDSLERSATKNHRRFSVACGPDLGKQFQESDYNPNIKSNIEKMSQSWRDVRTAVEGYQFPEHTAQSLSDYENRSLPVSEIIVNNTIEPLYGNTPKLGSLTIQVRGSPEQNRRKVDQFDPDTLDRKPKGDEKKRVDKILLKSGGSFKYNSITTNDERQKLPDITFNRKIGSLRQIYEAKAKAQEDEVRFNKCIYERRASVCNVSYDSDEHASFLTSVKTPDLLRRTESQKPPVPPKQRRASDACYVNVVRDIPPSEFRRRSPEERERLYNRNENLNARKSGRRSNRTRSRRTDLRKLYKTEDSGYLSTDSNESKRRANYLMQLKPRSNLLHEQTKVLPSINQLHKAIPSLSQIESDTDELESLCDGRSESGGESIETDSVFFGNFDESKQMLADLDMSTFDPQTTMIQRMDQIDSGFVGETSIILSESDSEHKSVISIIAGSDGRASASSIAKLDDSPFMCQIEC